MSQVALETKQVDFSLSAGGLAYEFFRRMRLSGDEPRFIRRRVLSVVAILWLPPLILTIIAGTAYSDAIRISFFNSLLGHVRFLVVLPILIGVEPYIHRQLNIAIRLFSERNLIPAEEMADFHRAIDKTHDIRNSYILELGLLVVVYTAGLWFWGSRQPEGSQTWYANPNTLGLNLTLAGYWLVFVSLPMFQFFLVRWYARFFILFWMLLQISKLKLNLIPTHPDRSGGLGFLGRVTYAFSPLLFAQGALLSAMIATEVMQNGKDIGSFLVESIGYIAFFVIGVLVPLCVFVPEVARAKRKGLRIYGTLAARYVEEFDKKWIRSDDGEREELLGTADIQSLADLGNSYNVVSEMNLAPFNYRDIFRLTAITAAPLIPLLLLVFSAEELFKKILEVFL
jgi:hypothetical protein